jgi:hypothetical protein
MDTQIAIWEMSLESEPQAVPDEGLATWPSEPYQLDWSLFNWN